MRSFRVLAGITTASLTVFLAAPVGATPGVDAAMFEIHEPPPPVVNPAPPQQAPAEPSAENSPADPATPQNFEVEQVPVSPEVLPDKDSKNGQNEAIVPKVPNMHVTIGKPFQYHIAAPEDTYVAVVSGLPAGLVFHPLSSEIIGTPAESPEGDYRVGITTYNRHGQVGNGSFVMTLTHKDHGNPSVIQEILRRPERGVELIKELIQKLLGTNQEK